MTVIFGGEVYTVWLRLVTLQVVIFQQGAPHLDNLKTAIKRAETTRLVWIVQGMMTMNNK